jgi:trimethylamine--corrinoid protein Co-methyltransferase
VYIQTRFSVIYSKLQERGINMINGVKWKSEMEVLNNEEIMAIHEASLYILEKTGILMPLDDAKYDRLEELGVKVGREKQKVYFPPQVIEEALKKAPSTYTLYARNPENDLPLDGTTGYLTLDGCGNQIIDLDTGELCSSSKKYLGQAVCLADALPQVGFLWPCISAQDCNPKIQPLHELQAMLINSAKHAQAMTAVDPLNAKGSVEIAAAVVGGKENLRKRPIISNFQCSISPLSYDGHGLEAALIFAEAGVPTGFMNMQIGCSTAPATLAGNLALGNAEIVAGMAFLQIFCPGAPTFYGSSATMMELRRGGVTCGGPEDFLLQAASAQMAHFYGVPANVGTFATGAKASDWHAGVENAISGSVSMFSKVDMMSGAGLINGARIFSFAQCMMDCEIYEIVRRVTEGIAVSQETLALEVIDRVGSRNHYMVEEHTINHLKEVWQPTVIDRSLYDEWVAKGKPAPDKIAREKAKEILAKHQPLPLDNGNLVEEIIKEYEKMVKP